MARPKKSNSQKIDPHVFSFKLLETESKELREKIKNSGLKQSEYLRKQICESDITVIVRQKVDSDTAKNIMKIGGNLNQLLTVLNYKIKLGVDNPIEDIKADLIESLKTIKEMRQNLIKE